jgi:Flp pilus assembly protein TadG
LRHILTALVLAAAFAVTAAPSASAIGNETFGCRIAPGTEFGWYQYCTNTSPAVTTYNVAFLVQNTTGTYTYSWSVSGPYQYVITGCTSTSPACAVSVSGGQSDKEITGTVTITQDGQSITRQAYAYVHGFCGPVYC